MCKLNADLICIELKNSGVLLLLKIIFTATVRADNNYCLLQIRCFR